MPDEEHPPPTPPPPTPPPPTPSPPAPSPTSSRRRWLLAGLGVVCVVVGAALTVRPVTSLRALGLLVAGSLVVSGVADVVDAAGDPQPGLRRLTGAGLVLAGGVALFHPALGTVALAVVAGLALVASGVRDVVAAVRRRADRRVTVAMRGAAGVIAGVVALAWPAITVLVMAIAFGARTVIVSGSLLGEALRSRGHRAAVPGRGHRWVGTVAAGAALVVAVLLGTASVVLHAGEPFLDEFYAVPDDVPATPGALLRAEPFTRGMPDRARAWRILYTTTRDDGVPAVSSGLVVVPAAPASSVDGPRPVIAWAHGTTGVHETCAPSALGPGLEAGAFFALDRVLDQNWVLVATDYIGLGTPGPHPYLIGQGEGRSVLDSVRAARQLTGVSLDDRTVIWGHSQGGHAALWAGQLAPSYAPDAGVVGVAALAPASDLTGLVTNLSTLTGGSVFASYVLSAYADTYADVAVADYVAPTARLTVRDLARRCLAEPAVLTSFLSSVATSWSVFARDPASGPAGERLRENTPTGAIEAPLLVAQGLDDGLVVPAVQAGYVGRRCAGGQAVDERTYAGRDHVGLVMADSPLLDDLVAWTQDRFEGRPPTPTCGS